MRVGVFGVGDGSPLVEVVGCAVEELTNLLEVLALNAVGHIIEKIGGHGTRYPETDEAAVRIRHTAEGEYSLNIES